MPDNIDPWFLQIIVPILAGYFLWSIQRLLRDFKEEIRGLKETLRLLFHKNDDHENRLSRIEGRCDAMHGKAEQPGGRRIYDPEERVSD